MLYLIKLIDFISIVKRVKKVVDNYFVGTIKTSLLVFIFTQYTNKNSLQGRENMIFKSNKEKGDYV